MAPCGIVDYREHRGNNSAGVFFLPHRAGVAQTRAAQPVATTRFFLCRGFLGADRVVE